MTSTLSVCEQTKFDPQDFCSRWNKARISSLRSVLPAENDTTDEGALLALVPEEQRPAALTKVFDCSRQLGISVSRYLGMTFEMADFSELLQQAGISCWSGRWRAHNQALVLERSGCEWGTKLGSFGCDYWREALDGLVTGAGETERLARHRSRGHGDSQCVDVLFTEEYSLPRIVKADGASVPARQKFGTVPDEMIQALKPLLSRFESMNVQVLLEGLSEGALYYRLETAEGVLCGAGGKLLHESFCKELSTRLPFVTAKDSSPLAVYGGST